MKTTQTLEYSDAKKTIDVIVEKALQMRKAAVIAVADSHGELIAFARMDGAPISSNGSAQRQGMRQLADGLGYRLHFEVVSEERLIQTSILSTKGGWR